MSDHKSPASQTGPRRSADDSVTEKGAVRDEEMALADQKLNDTDPEHSDTVVEESEGFHYITGGKLHIITFTLCLGLFLINFEVTVVGASVVAIANSLQDFRESSWVITSYLCTYIAGLVIWAKLSDIYGRKNTLLVSLALFAAFSGGCGASQTMVQLIICRAFQGIGGAGLYAVTMVMLYELVPVTKYPILTAIATAALALGLALGPIIGGAITNSTWSEAWRWVFLVNCPASVVVGAILWMVIPNDYPHQGRLKRPPKASIWAIDFPGVVLLVAAMVLTLTGFEQAASTLEWKAAKTLGPLCSSIVPWSLFVLRQYYVTKAGGVTQPIFPWRFFQNRVFLGLLVHQLMTGVVTISSYYSLPIRWQLTTGISPLQAGVRTIPLTVMCPVGILIAAMLSKNRRMPVIYTAIVGSIFQLLGTVFMSLNPTDKPTSYQYAMYGLEVLVGLGFGAGITLGTLLPPFMVEKRDLATATGATIQVRFFGGETIIAIMTAAGNRHFRNRLLAEGSLGETQIESLFVSTASVGQLPETLQSLIHTVWIEAFNIELKIVLGCAAAGLLACALVWQRPNIRVT